MSPRSTPFSRAICCQAGWEGLFKSVDRPARPERDGGGGPKACGSPWLRSSRLRVCLATAHAELLPDPLAEIDEPPSHDPVDGRCRPGLDQAGQRLAVLGRQSRRRAGSLAIDQTRGSMGVELHHPVANDLNGHATDPGRLAPRRPFVDRGQRQKPPRLRLHPSIALPPGGTPSASKSVLSAIGMANIPPFAMLNQNRAASGIPGESALQGRGISYRLPEAETSPEPTMIGRSPNKTFSSSVPHGTRERNVFPSPAAPVCDARAPSLASPR